MTIFFISSCIMFFVLLWQGSLCLYRFFLSGVKVDIYDKVLALFMVFSSGVTSIGLALKISNFLFPT